MPILETRTVRTHVQILGEGEPAIVMIHGLFVGSLAEWYFTVAPTLARRRRVVMYDLRGHGRSERVTSGYDLATLALDLESLMEALPIEPPVDLVGHSYGGLTALHLALRRPRAVRRLALVDVPLPPSSFRGLPFDGIATASADARGIERLVASLPAPLREGIERGGRRGRRLLDNLRFLGADSTLLRDLAREPDIADESLSTLDLPVLCVFGASSPCLPAGKRIARLIPGAALQTLPGGHFLPLERPAELTATLSRFLLG